MPPTKPRSTWSATTSAAPSPSPMPPSAPSVSAPWRSSIPPSPMCSLATPIPPSSPRSTSPGRPTTWPPRPPTRASPSALSTSTSRHAPVQTGAPPRQDPVVGTIRRHSTALAGSLAALSSYIPETDKLGGLATSTTIFTTANARPVTRYTNQRLANLTVNSHLVDLPAGDPDDPLRSPLSGAAAAAIAEIFLSRSLGD